MKLQIHDFHPHIKSRKRPSSTYIKTRNFFYVVILQTDQSTKSELTCTCWKFEVKLMITIPHKAIESIYYPIFLTPNDCLKGSQLRVETLSTITSTDISSTLYLRFSSFLSFFFFGKRHKFWTPPINIKDLVIDNALYFYTAHPYNTLYFSPSKILFNKKIKGVY